MIDFIPVSEYAHYFDVTVLCMVLDSRMAAPHRKRIEKRDRVAQRHVGRIIYTNPDLVDGATSCQRLFRRHGKLRQRILYCSQLTRSLFLQWKANGCFTTLCNGLPDTATSILFSCYVPLFISVHCGWL